MNAIEARRQAQHCIETGDLESALDLYQQAISRWQDDASLALEYGAVLWRCFEFDAAEAQLDRALDLPGAGPAITLAAARLYFEAGRFGSAADTVARLIVRGDPDEPILTLYASALERAGNREQARSIAHQALNVNPASARAARLMAHLDKREGGYDAAVTRLRQHLARFPSEDDWRLRYELAGVLDRTGQYDDAWQTLVLAKTQLASQTAEHLRQSLLIRARQWEVVNRLTDDDLSAWHRRAGELIPPLRVTLMAGFPRSGTTLLEQVLASHPACIGTDETGVLGSQFISPFIWQAGSTDEALEELRGFDDQQLAAGRSAYLRATEQFIGESVAGRLLIEKEPLLTADLSLPLRLLPEATVLMPLRDPRDVLVSYFFTMVPLSWNSAPSGEIVQAAKFYADCMRHWLHLRGRLPNPWFAPRYEDLVANPGPITRDLVRFLGLEWDDVLLDLAARSEGKAIRTPTYDDISKPITPRAVGRWKNYEKHLSPVLDVIEPYIDAFGY